MATMNMCARLVKNIPLQGLTPLYRSTGHRNFLRAFAVAPNSETKETGAKCADTGSVDSATETVSIEEFKKLEAQLEEVLSKHAKETNEWQDKYKRSLAEMENVRQRMKKQVEESKLFGIQGFCKDLLDVADILGKATESVPPEEVSDSNPHLKSLFEGLTMTEAQLNKVFTRHGLVKLDPPEGDKFDPHLHQALFEQPANGKVPGTVAVVTKVGYKLHDRTIRPAIVGVYKSSV